MTQEEKQLLFKDLCTRLPYEVEIQIYDDYLGMMKDERLNVFHLDSTYSIEYRKLRPYLRPMSSMTVDEIVTYSIYHDNPQNIGYGLIDWLNSNHFDYRGLIEKGLALEAPKGMYNN